MIEVLGIAIQPKKGQHSHEESSSYCWLSEESPRNRSSLTHLVHSVIDREQPQHKGDSALELPALEVFEAQLLDHCTIPSYIQCIK